jgi:argininosuccinate lyase
MRATPIAIVSVLTVLGAFTTTAQAQTPRDAFYWLGEMNKASAVMVVEQGIVPAELGATIANAVGQVIAEAGQPGASRSGDYLAVEQLLVAVGGPDVTRLHSGRSRQDLGATSRRLFLREDLLAAVAALGEARRALLQMASRHPNAIVPAYTWGVQAQPVSFGHYVLAYTEALSRAAERYRQAWSRVNQSPLGAAALGTSSFPVNRPRLAELLGFDGVIENSLDANQIAPIDTGAEVVGVAASSALTIGTLVADITTQYAQTKPWLMLAEGDLTGTSSIMPQKRNPTGIVNLRSVASTLVGEAQTYLIQAHNVSAGMGDYKGDQPGQVLQQAARLYAALANVLGELVLDEARALAEVEAEYSTTTELADTLQRAAGVPFRVGHHFASELVNFGRSRSLRPSEIPYADARRIYREAADGLGIADRELPLDEGQFRRSLSAANMVQASQGLGGPQPSEVARMLADQAARVAADDAWLAETRARLDAAARQRDEAFNRLRAAR